MRMCHRSKQLIDNIQQQQKVIPVGVLLRYQITYQNRQTAPQTPHLTCYKQTNVYKIDTYIPTPTHTRAHAYPIASKSLLLTNAEEVLEMVGFYYLPGHN